jgi:hypothetical protein
VTIIRSIVLLLIVLCPAIGSALDHDNLDPNRPIAIEDAYAIPKGEIGLEAGARINDRREGGTLVTFQPQIIYGAFYNTQIELQGNLFNDPGTLVGAEKSGDFHVGVLYNLNTETVDLPAFAMRVGVEFPTGHNSQGVDHQYTGIMTKSLGRLRAHVNIGYTVLGLPRGRERPGGYRAIAAVSYPLGYPTSLMTTGIVGVYTRQSDLRGQRNPAGLEAGIRRQLSSRLVLDAGLGSEFYGPSDRTVLMGTMGLSLGF